MRVAMILHDETCRSGLSAMLTREGIQSFDILPKDLTLNAAEGEVFDAVLLRHDDPSAMREILLALRRAGAVAPIIVLSALATADMCVLALRLGADDCVAEPFRIDELAARIRAVARRSRVTPLAKIVTGKLTIDLERKTVSAGGRVVGLTVKEFDVLELLASAHGAIVTKPVLIEKMYRGLDEPTHRVIDVFICKLRRKLAAATDGMEFITTVWGLGYRWGDQIAAKAA